MCPVLSSRGPQGRRDLGQREVFTQTGLTFHVDVIIRFLWKAWHLRVWPANGRESESITGEPWGATLGISLPPHKVVTF